MTTKLVRFAFSTLVASGLGVSSGAAQEASPSAGHAAPAPASPPAPKGIHEVFAHADDGTPLRWTVFVPPGPGRHPAVVVIHGGGFMMAPASPQTRAVAPDMAAAGFVAFDIEYRLAPPGHIAGQKSAGHYPDQTNDVHLAIHAARVDSRANGQVGAVGGSAGGYHVAYAAATGKPGDDQIDVGICLSGAYDLSDSGSRNGPGGFNRLVTNYINTTDSAKLRAASPVAFVTRAIPPLYLAQSEQEAMPPQQLPDLVRKLNEVGANNFQQITLPGRRHAFAYWTDVRVRATAFLKEGFAHPTSAVSAAMDRATRPGAPASVASPAPLADDSPPPARQGKAGRNLRDPLAQVSNVTADQHAQAKKIQDDARAMARAIPQDDDQRMQKMMAIRKDSLAKTRAVLTAGQQAEFDVVVAKMMLRGKKEQGPGDAGAAPPAPN